MRVEFVGGPYDGRVELVTKRLPKVVLRWDRALERHRPVGTYHHGTGEQRGLMLWRPIEEPPNG